MLHVTPKGQAEEQAMNNPTVFQRYIGPSLLSVSITLGTLFISAAFSGGASTEKVSQLERRTERLENAQSDGASKEDVKRVEDAVITIQGDVKQILRDQATQANKKR
jgi:hypothetical protein